MLTRDILREYTMENPPKVMLPRSPCVQQKYDAFICQSKNRSCFISDMRENLKCHPYYFVPNDFPYHTSPGIEHWVCWYGKYIEPASIIAEIKEKNNVITFWKNYSTNMSIQEINHIHVFIQK